MPQDIKREDVQALSSPDQVATFFLKLGYDVEARGPSSAGALGITGDVSHAIQHVERVASLNDGYEIQVYLFQLQARSVTMTAKKSISRAFRDRPGDYLLVLTTDYEQIDFMLVERSNVEAGMTQKEIIGTQPPIHKVGGTFPRFLTVNRSHPGDVALRVLRLFGYTRGQDVFEHSERLRNAYDVAYWSEEYFNNRALFSDYYLKERLPEERVDWKKPDGRESATRKRVQGTLSRLYDDAQDEYANESVQGVQTKLIEPVLGLLGFTAQAVKTKKGDERTPDYTLYATDTLGRAAGEKPLAVCLAYRWQRDLDRQVDEREDPETADENPGAVVVALLDKGEADWAMLTNGKMWRLYAAKAHSRATNYYEIDLEDIMISNVAEREEAFKYFWFLFRHDSFLPTEDGGTRSLLDALLSESEQYARRLGDRLKNRIFEDVFHHFAQGFVDYAQEEKLLPTDLDSLDEQERERRLKPYFDGTLTFLYRLLFLLYAESRNLLPVRETDSYYQMSLEKLKQDIKGRAGESGTDAPGRIRYAYGSTNTALYDTLQTVFRAVDKGDKDLNVPIYNGGLFMTEPYLLDTSAEAVVAQFLRTHKIPDQYLALGFDLMARDEDEKKSGLVLVDYKSLGVRQLGSIYEGLLEFKLHMATQAMTVVRMEKNKKTEKIVPYQEAQAKKLSIVRERHEGMMRERVYNLGEVYLENDRSERKATGSYYTPDYIVKYIVQNTVGPVLEQKLEALRKTFEEVEETLGINKQRNKALEQRRLAPENAEERTYQHYEHTLNEQFFDLKVLDPAMGSGHFLVEAVDYITDKMTRFLEGFPWNPVVHHLGKIRDDTQREMEQQEISIDVSKLTNINLLKRQVLKRCIYGVDLNPMAVELAKVSVWLDSFTLGAPLSFLDHHLKCGNSLIGGSIQVVQKALSTQLLGSQFAGLLSGAQLMRLVGERTDSTADEVAQSRQMFKEADSDLAPYKRLMNVWVSEYFGSKGAQKTVDRFGQEIIDNKYAHIDKIDKDAIEVAQILAERKRFFHWDLEFPEVFYDKTERKQNEGFDAVVGNPPWGAELSKEEKNAMLPTFRTSQSSSLDSYAAFTETSVVYLNRGGNCGYIVPDTVLRKDDLVYLRRFLLTETQINELIETGPLFKEVRDTWCLILIISKRKPQERHEIRHKQISRFIVSSEERLELFGQQKWSRSSLTRQQVWQARPNLIIGYLASQEEQSIIDKIEKASLSLNKHNAKFSISRGEEGSKFTFLVKDDEYFRMVIPEDVERYWVGEGVPISENILTSNKLRDFYTHPKVWIIRIQKLRWQQRIVAAFDVRANSASMKTLQVVISLFNDQKSLRFLSTILVSRLLNFGVRISWLMI